MEEEFRGAFGESAEGVARKEREEGAGEEAARARARCVETVPSAKEVEELNLDYGIYRMLAPSLCEGVSRGIRTCSRGDWRT